MMYKARVTLDMDSTFVDLLGPWLNAYNAQHGDDLTVDKCVTWNLHPHARAGKAIYAHLETPGFFRTLQPFPGAVEGVRRLIDAGVEVLVWTHSNHPEAYSDKAASIRQHLPDVHGYIVSGSEVKKHEIPTDYVIDDSPGTAEGFKRAKPGVYVMGIEYPYNAGNRCFDLLAKDWRDPAAAWQTMVDTILTREGL